MSIQNPKRRRGDKRERTRAALVEATLEIVAEKGFAAASLDEIAARAGMTKGAIYSNFGGKAELMLAAMMARGLTVDTAAPVETSLADHVRGMADALAATVFRARGEAALLAEFQVYALGDAELRAGLAAVYADSFGQTAAYLAALPGGGDPAAARSLAVALQSISLGFVVQSMITPAEVTPDVIREALETLAVGLQWRGASGRPSATSSRGCKGGDKT